MVRQRVHLRELVVDACDERERIEPVALACEGRDLDGVGVGADADAVKRGLRRDVVPAEARGRSEDRQDLDGPRRVPEARDMASHRDPARGTR
jgi:hypothetical protein